MSGAELAILDWIQVNLRCGVLDAIMVFFTTIGDNGAVWLIAALACLCRPQWRRAGIGILIALVLSFAVSSLLIKPFVMRPRPCDVMWTMSLLIDHPSGWSFPSSHSATSFAVAFLLLFSRNRVWPAAMVAAALIAFSRMYLYVHYPTDVLAGALVGCLCAFVANRLLVRLQRVPRMAAWMDAPGGKSELSFGWTAFCGLSMALADSVPGVSGGTVAFIMGFYDCLISSLNSLVRGSAAERKEALRYLAKLACGWVVGMGLAMIVLSKVLESGVYALSSAFLGLTLAAIPLIVYRERAVLRAKPWLAVFTVVGLALVAGISLMRLTAGSSALDFANLDILTLAYLVLAGFVAISAMVLPGISGSTLLLIFGVYGPAVFAVKQLLAGQGVVLFGLLALAIGAVLGVVIAVGVLKRALERFRPAMLYLIVGLMLGSLVSIVLGPTTLSSSQPPLSLETFNVFTFALGVLVLVGLEAARVACRAATEFSSVVSPCNRA